MLGHIFLTISKCGRRTCVQTDRHTDRHVVLYQFYENLPLSALLDIFNIICGIFLYRNRLVPLSLSLG